MIVCASLRQKKILNMLRVFKQYYPIRNVFFIIGEGLVIFASVLLASWIVIGYNSFVIDELLWLKALLVALFCFMGLYYNDLYDMKVTDSFLELGIRLFQALGGAAIFLALIYILFPQLVIGRGIFMISTIFTIVFVVTWRIGYTVVLNQGLFNQKIIIIGSGELAKNIIDEVQEKKDCGYSIEVVVVEYNCENSCINNNMNIQVNGTIAQKSYQGLCEIGKTLEIDKIIMAIEEKRGNFPVEELLRCRVGGIEVLEGVAFYEMLTGKLIVEQINPAWLIFSQGFQTSWARRFLKEAVTFSSHNHAGPALSLVYFDCFNDQIGFQGPGHFFSGTYRTEPKTLQCPQISIHGDRCREPQQDLSGPKMMTPGLHALE